MEREILKQSWTQPIAVVYKNGEKTERIDYFINGSKVEFHRFKQRVKRLDPVKIITKNINEK